MFHLLDATLQTGEDSFAMRTSWLSQSQKQFDLRNKFSLADSEILNFSKQSQLAFENVGSVLHFVRGGLSRAIE